MIFYSLKTCNTCRKARKWLMDENIVFEERDVRQDGIEENDLKKALALLGWEKVLNRRSTTWRAMDENEKTGLDNQRAHQLIMKHPTLLKRPLFVTDNALLIGFDASSKAALKAAL